MHGLGQVRQLAPLGEDARVLLGVERVASGAGEQLRPRLGREQWLGDEPADEPCGLLIRERGERDCERVRLATTPARSPLQELRPRRADDEERNSAHPVDEVIKEVEQVLVAPMQILQNQNERPLRGKRLEELPPGGKRLRALVAAAHLRRAKADKRAQVRLESAILNRLVQLPPNFLGRVALEDSRLGLDNFAERPERDTVTVWKTAALTPRDQLLIGIDDPGELVNDPRLPDSRDADQSDQLWLALLARALEGLRKETKLSLSPDQDAALGLLHIHADPRARPHHLPHRHWLGLALGINRLVLPIRDYPLGRTKRRLPHQDAVDRRRRLHARRRVEHIARSQVLPPSRPRPQDHQRLTRVHRHPHVQIRLLAHPLFDPQCRPHRALRVILVRQRHAKQSHHRVTDELLDRATKTL